MLDPKDSSITQSGDSSNNEVSSSKSNEGPSQQQEVVSSTYEPDKDNVTPLDFDVANVDNKRQLSDVDDTDEENKKKKRREDYSKDSKIPPKTPQTRSNSQAEKLKTPKSTPNLKSHITAVINSIPSNGNSPKQVKSESVCEGESDDSDRVKGDNFLKVPPLKIVLPTAGENEVTSKSGKSVHSRHGLPYVVNPSGEDLSTVQTDQNSVSAPNTPKTDVVSFPMTPTAESLSDKNSLRVTRSSLRSASPLTSEDVAETSALAPEKSSSPLPPEENANSNSMSGAGIGSYTALRGDDVKPEDIHPRKRKLKTKEVDLPATFPLEPVLGPTPAPDSDQPFMNCYDLVLNIRRQVERRRSTLFPVQPKPPQGFKDYLMNRCSYVLAGNAASRLSVPVTPPPQGLPAPLKEMFTEQEAERYRLRLQHIVEKEKLVLSVEQEILRVHGRAARALANQSLPFSVCTILRDAEIYNPLTREQEEKDRNARSRYNGRLFLSWLQDVDDKWEKIKEAMLLRHHNESESLHAVQRMAWEWKLVELGADRKSLPVIDEIHVPMVYVSDDFDLLPA